MSLSASDIPAEYLPYFLGEATDNSSNQLSILKVNIIFMSLVALTCGLRIFVRFRMLGAAGYDDILIIIALLLSLLLSTSCLVGVRFGLGKHVWNLSDTPLGILDAAERVTKALFGSYMAYAAAITATKLSIIATYMRIFPHEGYLRKAVLLVAAIVVLLFVASIFAIILTCIPVQAAWDFSIKNPKCYPVERFFFGATAINIITDLILCFLPFPSLWALRMPKPQRIILCLIFSMGTFACVASVLRLLQLHNIGTFDTTYSVVGSLNWSVIEVGTGIMCASLSALRPLATRILPKMFSHFSTASTDGRDNFVSLKESRNKSQTPPSVSETSHIFIQQTFVVEEQEMNALQPPPAVPEPAKTKSQSRRISGPVRMMDVSSEEELVVMYPSAKDARW